MFPIESDWLVEQLDPANLHEFWRYDGEEPWGEALAKYDEEELKPFLAQMQPDDELWSWESPDFRRLRGFRGLAILREGEPVATLMTAIS